MTNLAKNLEFYRIQAGFKKQDDLAKALGVARGTVNGWEAGKKIRKKNIAKLCEVLKATREKLYGATSPVVQDIEAKESPTVYTADNPQKVLIPVVGTISAGPLRLVDPTEAKTIITGGRGDDNRIALVVKGDSMEPIYRDGDKIVCDKDNFVFGEEIAAHVPFDDAHRYHNKDCVCLLDNESTFKRIKIERARGEAYSVILFPLNAAHHEIKLKQGQTLKIQAVCRRIEHE